MPEDDEKRWMVWYHDDSLEPIAVQARSLNDALWIGRKARGVEPMDAIPPEHGAKDDLEGIDEDCFSTREDPHRFIEQVLEPMHRDATRTNRGGA